MKIAVRMTDGKTKVFDTSGAEGCDDWTHEMWRALVIEQEVMAKTVLVQVK